MNLKIFKVLTILVIFSSHVLADDNNKELSFYTGTFDVIDKEGDDKTTLIGIEHKNPDLFRDTILGKFKPEEIQILEDLYKKIMVHKDKIFSLEIENLQNLIN